MRDERLRIADCGLRILVALFLAAGCGRANVTTEIRPDGSWTRQIVLHAHAQKQGEPGPGSLGPKLEEVFSYPTAAPWKVTKQTGKDEVTITADRTLVAGA